MPKNQFKRMIFALITVINTVHAYVFFYSLYVVNGTTLMKIIGKEIVIDKICNKKELSKEKEKLENSLTEQVEKIQELIDMNSRVAQNQEKYKKEYDAMIKTYDETKFKYEQLEIESSQQAAKH